MNPSNMGPVRPVLEEAPARRPRWQAASAVALGLVLLIVVLLVLGRDQGPGEETTTLAAPSTTAVTTTVGATMATTILAAGGLDALAAFQAGPVPPAAVCPSGSTPDVPGDVTAPRPPAASYPVAFDLESGLLVLSVHGSTWAFDPCWNRWAEMGAGGPDLDDGGDLVYDADSDLIVAFDDTGGWTYDLDTDTWTRKSGPPLGETWHLVYHDPSGLVVARAGFGGAIDAYDADSDTWYDLASFYSPDGWLAYDPAGDRFYLDYEGGLVWRYEPGEGWTQTGTPGFAGRSLTRDWVAFAESTGQFVVSSGGGVAVFDPVVLPGWEVLDDHYSQEGPLNRVEHSVVYDSANGRVIVLGGEYLGADGA